MKELKQLRELNIKNPYLVLNIKYDATEREINLAYQKLIKTYQNKGNHKEDNYYLFQIFQACRNVLLNPTTRKILDKQLGVEEKEDSDIDKFSINKNIERLLESTKNETKKKEIRTTILLPEILEELNLTNKDYLSFKELTTILKIYLTRTINSYNSDIEACSTIENNKLFLLDKKGNLKYIILKRPLLRADYIEDYFSCKVLYTFRTYQPYIEKYNDELLLFDCSLIKPDKILPDNIGHFKDIKMMDLIKCLELSNECLQQLVKDDYLVRGVQTIKKKLT